MSVEARPQKVRASIESFVKENASAILEGKRLDTGGLSPEELVGPCIEHLVSLQPPGERSDARTHYQAQLAGAKTFEDPLRLVASRILSEWQKNNP